MQRSTTSLMIFGIPAIIAYCSRLTELEPSRLVINPKPMI
ncbi:MAG: hypothetical protein AB7E55_27990 [Pigmentiphaga sp.]